MVVFFFFFFFKEFLNSKNLSRCIDRLICAGVISEKKISLLYSDTAGYNFSPSSSLWFKGFWIYGLGAHGVDGLNRAMKRRDVLVAMMEHGNGLRHWESGERRRWM